MGDLDEAKHVAAAGKSPRKAVREDRNGKNEKGKKKQRPKEREARKAKATGKSMAAPLRPARLGAKAKKRASKKEKQAPRAQMRKQFGLSKSASSAMLMVCSAITSGDPNHNQGGLREALAVGDPLNAGRVDVPHFRMCIRRLLQSASMKMAAKQSQALVERFDNNADSTIQYRVFTQMVTKLISKQRKQHVGLPLSPKRAKAALHGDYNKHPLPPVGHWKSPKGDRKRAGATKKISNAQLQELHEAREAELNLEQAKEPTWGKRKQSKEPRKKARRQKKAVIDADAPSSSYGVDPDMESKLRGRSQQARAHSASASMSPKRRTRPGSRTRLLPDIAPGDARDRRAQSAGGQKRAFIGGSARSAMSNKPLAASSAVAWGEPPKGDGGRSEIDVTGRRSWSRYSRRSNSKAASRDSSPPAHQDRDEQYRLQL